MKAYEKLAQKLRQISDLDEKACQSIATRLAQTQRIRAICEDSSSLANNVLTHEHGPKQRPE